MEPIQALHKKFTTGVVNMNSTATNQRGFSLINGIIALAVVGVLFGAVVPQVTAIVLDNRATTETEEIARALNLARSQAVTLRKQVIVSAHDADWSQGMQIWVDHNGDKAMSEDELLYRLPALITGASLKERSERTEFSFDTRGFARTAITFDYLAEAGCNWNHEIKVKYTGRTTLKDSGCL